MFACVAALLVWLAALDLDHRLLPNRIVLPAAAAVLLAQTALSPGRAAAFVAAAVVAAGFFLAFALAKPGALGMGDVKLAFLLGAAFGRGVIPVLVIGCLAASLFAAGVLVAHGKSAVGRTIAFAPFLALGALAAVFGGIA
jgi:leader peptidase (prepilin peptidase)/N-methyltransferase